MKKNKRLSSMKKTLKSTFSGEVESELGAEEQRKIRTTVKKIFAQYKKTMINLSK